MWLQGSCRIPLVRETGDGAGLLAAYRLARTTGDFMRDNLARLALLAAIIGGVSYIASWTLDLSQPASLAWKGTGVGFLALYAALKARSTDGWLLAAVMTFGVLGDVLLGISTSGNSGNVIKAIAAAREKGMKVITLTGKDGGKMDGTADVEIRVPHFGYADRIQEIHIKVIHILIQLIEKEMVK